MKVLVVNAGSSSLKYQLIDMETEKLLAKGLVERIAKPGSCITHSAKEQKISRETPVSDHVEACRLMLQFLSDPEVGVVSSLNEIDAVGHRVLHGGSDFTESVIIDESVKQAITDNIPLGPLHNPANLKGIEACQEVMPDVPMVAVFDTAFHQTMPEKSFLYGVPYSYYEKHKVRRYGFHGTSHRYVSAEAARFLNKPIEELRIITCHLGNGSSLCAVDHGKCVDTSMGIAPLEGVLMGTRCGSVDATVVEYLCEKEKISVHEVLHIMNNQSGLLGISGVSHDMRDVDEAAKSGNARAKLARDMLVYGVRKYIGAYAAAMNGVDVIAFTAGIGENNFGLRADIMDGFHFIGAAIDPEKNRVQGEEKDISAADSRVKVLVIPTNEELTIARDTVALCEKSC